MALAYHTPYSINAITGVHTYTLMPFLALAYFILSYRLTLVFGFLQTPECLPKTQAETITLEVYSVLSVALVCTQALASVVVSCGTTTFPHAALFLAFTLLCHHTIFHRHSRFEGDICSCFLFQVKDVSIYSAITRYAIVAAVISWQHI